MTVVIISLLCGLGLVGFKNALAASRSSRGAANLHQLGMTVALFVAEHGYYPPGAGQAEEGPTGVGFWYDVISPYWGAEPPLAWSNGGTKPNVNVPSMVDSPAKAIKTAKSQVAFTANPDLMPDIIFSTPKPLIRAAKIQRASEIIMLMDGVQAPGNGVVLPYTYDISGRSNDPARSGEVFSPFQNLDNGKALPRFRHRNEKFMQAVFVDGHVDYIANGTLTRGNFSVEY